MLLVEEALQIILRANAGLTALVGTRITPGVLSQSSAYPAIAYRLVDRDHATHLSGRASTGLARSGFRFFSASKGATAYSDTKRVNEALRLALMGFSGTVQSAASPPLTLHIQRIEPTGTREFYDDPTQTWQVQSDYDVWASEQIPT